MRINIILIGLLLVLINGATASIEIRAPVLDIRLGESIYADISITHDETTFGFLSIILNCNEKTRELMREQMETTANSEVIIPFLQIITSISETTECKLQANFLNNEGDIIYNEQTNQFLVENRLNTTIAIPNKELKPNDTLNINITIHEDEKHQSGTVAILFNRQTTRHTIQGNTDITYTIPENTRPGTHAITITVTDRYGNTHETTERISIKSIPTSISIQTPQERYYANQPNETMYITPTLYDQAGNIYNEELTITIKDPENKSILEKKTQSGEQTKYIFTNTTKPGIYSIHANHESFENKITVNVLNSIYQRIEYREEQDENIPLQETYLNETAQEALESKETSKEKTTTRLRKNIQNGAGIIVLALIIIIALSIYNKKQKNRQNPKSNEFFNFEKKKNTRNKHKIKRVIKADPYEHDED
ncbi:MAG: hypothetical protein ACMXYE_01920 [Candidatus Woesearchaeota archaeon]